MRKLPTPFSGNKSKESIRHESAVKHVTGSAQYVDDVPEFPGQLFVATGQSTVAHARIKKISLERVRSARDVVDVIVQSDIPGNPDISPVFSGDLLLAGDTINYIGQPLFAVAARSLRAAKKACALAEIEYEALDATLTPQKAYELSDFVLPTHEIRKGDYDAAIASAALSIDSELYIKGQEHFYIEGQISVAIPTEDGAVKIFSSSQHPAEVQKLVAHVLAVPVAMVEVETRRMGGGFGGKESQAAALACMAAVFAIRNKCSVKYRMPRQDDMIQTGKRHDFWNRYQCGFTEEGKILGVELDLIGMCGCTADLSDGVVDRAMFHSDNAYYYDTARIAGYRAKTNTVSNTAFRGFGGPKGLLLAEVLVDDIARKVGKDPLDIRKLNLYKDGQNTTPYGQIVEENVLPDLIEELEDSSNYRQRRQEISDFNATNKYLKKGLALTPVKFGISFTSKHLNQGGALVHVYTDGSVHVNHGGTEMGQGLYTKVAQIVASGFGISYSRVHVSATKTDKVPNASPTAASAGTDLNGMAALNAVNIIKGRLIDFAAEHYKADKESIKIENDAVCVGDATYTFEEFVKLAYFNRISLSSTGFYRTPRIHYDRKTATGRPFFYFANGAAVAEVIVDTLTGEYKLTQVDILHDVGTSLNEAVDIGQIEGAFIQGAGWLTTEELSWDNSGKIISNSPANYKIPTASDIPKIFNTKLFARENHEDTIYKSKAVGEPPLMLGVSVWCALRDACAAVADYKFAPPLSAPATPEAVYFCMQEALHRLEQEANE